MTMNIYLDYNATAPLRPSVLKAMQAIEGQALNPSSIHSVGREAKKLLEDSRKTIADSLSVFPNEVLFTGSATEANNMVLRGFDRPMLVSAIEHASITKTASLLGADTIAVDSNGIVNLEMLDKKLRALNTNLPLEGGGRRTTESGGTGGGDSRTTNHEPRTTSGTPPSQPSPLKGEGALVSIMLANNETGVIQPLAEIAKIVHAHGGLLHTDAVQAVGKIPLDFGLLGADIMTIGAHKVGGPVGIGALIMRNDLPIKPFITGGGQELGRRAGTEDVAKIIGFAALLQEVTSCSESKRLEAMRNALEVELADSIIFGKAAPRLVNTSLLAMPNVKSETQLMNFDLAGFAVSAGSACSSGRIEPSHVLKAMGVPQETASCAIRVSIGWNTGENDLKSFASAWKTTYERLGKSKAA